MRNFPRTRLTMTRSWPPGSVYSWSMGMRPPASTRSRAVLGCTKGRIYYWLPGKLMLFFTIHRRAMEMDLATHYCPVKCRTNSIG